MNCRTAVLGGFKAHCDHCGAETIQYASCRVTAPSVRPSRKPGVERQCADLLDIGYWHVVFTLPHDLNPVAQGNPALIYRLLFKAASQTLLEFGRNPRWLGGELGITMVMHTWGQNLGQHIDVHCIVTGGALSPDQQSWIATARKGFLFPTAALSKVFRGKYLDFLTDAHRKGELRMPGRDGLDGSRAFECLKTSLRSNNWVVYTKAPFAGAGQVLAYLGRYTHKTAIGNHRLVEFDAEHVRFRWRDYADGNKAKVMRLDADEFIRRFLLHVLPRGFTRLRHYGLLANRSRTRKLALCRALLGQPAPEPLEPDAGDDAASDWNRYHHVPAVRKGTAAADPHSRSAAPDGDASDEDQTTMTMRQSRPRPDINAPITAPRPPLCCSHPECLRNIAGCRAAGTEMRSEQHFRSGLASAVGNQPDRFDLIDSHQAVTFPMSVPRGSAHCT